MVKPDNEDDFPPDNGPVTVETDYEGRPPSVAVVAAIAAIEDTPPTEVDFSLYERIEPDALDALFADETDNEESSADVMAEFSIDEYVVQVRSDGTITVTSQDNRE